ncbi:MAG TPA: hypothetical protein ENH95_02830 [Nitrosopumilus sp.]|nr:hypothetical protein [Nitrosopumilus sp.]
MKQKCKHEHGWCSTKDTYVFVNEKGKLTVGFEPQNKITMRCNYPECAATINAYLEGKIKKQSKPKYEQKCELRIKCGKPAKTCAQHDTPKCEEHETEEEDP